MASDTDIAEGWERLTGPRSKMSVVVAASRMWKKSSSATCDWGISLMCDAVMYRFWPNAFSVPRTRTYVDSLGPL